ncbi:MAG: hypothetical protein JW934_04740 [Anaerolineae bacterium]|nr:hypothetical protein [Anaerolineae bacterium]
MQNELRDWVNQQLIARDWLPAAAARKVNIRTSTLTRFLCGERNAGTKLCQDIARAFDEPVETVYRLAGILPGTLAPTHTTQTQDLLSRLDEKGKRLVRRIVNDIVDIYG